MTELGSPRDWLGALLGVGTVGSRCTTQTCSVAKNVPLGCGGGEERARIGCFS